jgi:hypothetical protein
VVSYADRFAFGVTTDRDALPDGQVVATGIERAAAAIMAERDSRYRAAKRDKGPADTTETEESVDAPS